MSRDYAPNQTIWALASGSLEDLGEGHLSSRYDSLEVRQVAPFEAYIKVHDRVENKTRLFSLKLTEKR